MRNVVLTRVDERLIHGQVMTSWLKLCNANVILIIDAGSASNAFLKRILFAAAPKDVELQVMNEGRCRRLSEGRFSRRRKGPCSFEDSAASAGHGPKRHRDQGDHPRQYGRARPAESTSTRAFPPARTRFRHSVILWTPVYTSTARWSRPMRRKTSRSC